MAKLPCGPLPTGTVPQAGPRDSHRPLQVPLSADASWAARSRCSDFLFNSAVTDPLRPADGQSFLLCRRGRTETFHLLTVRLYWYAATAHASLPCWMNKKKSFNHLSFTCLPPRSEKIIANSWWSRELEGRWLSLWWYSHVRRPFLNSIWWGKLTDYSPSDVLDAKMFTASQPGAPCWAQLLSFAHYSCPICQADSNSRLHYHQTRQVEWSEVTFSRQPFPTAEKSTL